MTMSCVVKRDQVDVGNTTRYYTPYDYTPHGTIHRMVLYTIHGMVHGTVVLDFFFSFLALLCSFEVSKILLLWRRRRWFYNR